jgi:hypothetical protein
MCRVWSRPNDKRLQPIVRAGCCHETPGSVSKRLYTANCPHTGAASLRPWMSDGFVVVGPAIFCGTLRVPKLTWTFLVWPLEAVSPWEAELQGFYACRHTLAEMKRTKLLGE